MFTSNGESHYKRIFDPREHYRNETQSFSAAFFVLVPSSCWLFQNLSCKKNRLLLLNLIVQPFTNARREWWIRWVRNRPTHERTVRPSAMCYTYPCVRTHQESGYRMDIIFDGRLVDHYVTDERNAPCCVLVRLLSTHACQLLRRISPITADRRVEDHVPICI